MRQKFTHGSAVLSVTWKHNGLNLASGCSATMQANMARRDRSDARLAGVSASGPNADKPGEHQATTATGLDEQDSIRWEEKHKGLKNNRSSHKFLDEMRSKLRVVQTENMVLRKR